MQAYPKAHHDGSGYIYDCALAELQLNAPIVVDIIGTTLQFTGSKLRNRLRLVRALADTDTVSPNLRDIIISFF